MLEDNERVRILRDRIRLFRGCSLDEVRRLLKHASTRFLYDGQLVFREGAPADVLFVIISGHVRISRAEKGADESLAMLSPGTTVGEMAFIDEGARSARGVAMGDTVVLEFRRGILGEIEPPLLERLLRNLFAIIAERLRAANSRPPSGLDVSGPDLSGTDLRGAKLNRCTLTGVVAQKADLRGADLRGADLRGADLRGSQFSGADIRGVDMSGAIDDLSEPPKEVPCRASRDGSTSTPGPSPQRVGRGGSADMESWNTLDGSTRRVRQVRARAKRIQKSGS